MNCVLNAAVARIAIIEPGLPAGFVSAAGGVRTRGKLGLVQRTPGDRVAVGTSFRTGLPLRETYVMPASSPSCVGSSVATRGVQMSMLSHFVESLQSARILPMIFLGSGTVCAGRGAAVDPWVGARQLRV